MDCKRLFFGFEVLAEWPLFLDQESVAAGRILNPLMRHITVAFLGTHPFSTWDAPWELLPMPPFSIAPVALAEQLLFFPQARPRVAAARVQWLDDAEEMGAWFQAFIRALAFLKLKVEPWTPHLTLARAPFEKRWWEERFSPFPFFLKALHLYESLGHSTYRSLWTYPLLPPFEELPHTADRAWKIRGKSVPQIHRHAQIALGMQQPELLRYRSSSLQEDLDQVVIDLNRMVTACDSEEGCAFKAVSFHGQLKNEGSILTWEMVVDV